MNILKRIVLLVLIVVVLVIAAVSVYVKIYGKSLLENKLRTALNRDVVLGEIGYSFPLGLRARDVRITQDRAGKPFFEADAVMASLSLEAVTRRQLIFDSVVLVKPLLVLEITGESDSGTERRYGVMIPPESLEEPGPVKEEGRRLSTEITIKTLEFRKGRFTYINKSGDKDFTVAMDEVYLKAGHVLFPVRPGRTAFDVAGTLIKEGNPLSGSSVKGGGWVDIARRDMEARMEVVEQDGSVGMTATAVSQNNNMFVSGDVKFRNIFVESAPATAEASATNDLIMNALSSAGVKIGAQFSFMTKMDDFRPEQVKFSGKVETK